MKPSFLFITALLSLASFASAKSIEEQCQALKPAALNAPVKKFLDANKTSFSGNEQYVAEITSNLNFCFLILSQFKGETSANIDIVAYDPVKKKILRVEDAVPAPKTIRVGIGMLPNTPDNADLNVNNLFYTELSGKSAIEAHKSITAKFPNSGLTNGCVDAKITNNNGTQLITPTGKLTWDPITSRTWKLSHAEYSLQRGMTNESIGIRVDDIYAGQLDNDFAGYLKGSLPCNTINQPLGSVQSWGSAIITVFDHNGTEKPVTYDQRYYSQTPPVAEDTHEVMFKDSADGNECVKQIEALGITTVLIPMEGAPGFPPYGASVTLKNPVTEAVQQLQNLPCVDRITAL